MSSCQKQHGLTHVSSILMPSGNQSGFSLLKTSRRGRERRRDKHPGHGERNILLHGAALLSHRAEQDVVMGQPTAPAIPPGT